MRANEAATDGFSATIEFHLFTPLSPEKSPKSRAFLRYRNILASVIAAYTGLLAAF